MLRWLTGFAALLIAGSASAAGVRVTDLEILVNRQDSAVPTPIHRRYAELIDSAGAGDELILLQKYFRNQRLNRKIIAAAERGALVTALHGDRRTTECGTLLPPDSALDCAALFLQRDGIHHKSMLLHRSDGRSSAIIGSFNLRERHKSSPRAHTVLSFNVNHDDALYPFYAAEARRLVADKLRPEDVPSKPPAEAQALTLPTENNGTLSLRFHPATVSAPLEFLASIRSCGSTLWLAYFAVVEDAFSRRVLQQLKQLQAQGCSIRLLMSERDFNAPALQSLGLLGIPARYPTTDVGPMTLGHKLILVNSGSRLHLSQSSANLYAHSHQEEHNLTVHLEGEFPEIAQTLENELQRYWE